MIMVPETVLAYLFLKTVTSFQAARISFKMYRIQFMEFHVPAGKVSFEKDPIVSSVTRWEFLH